MEKVQQIVPITDLRLAHLKVFSLLKNGPVILAQRSKPAAVLVSTALWDDIAQRLEEQQDAIDVLQAEVEHLRSGGVLVEPDIAKLEQMAGRTHETPAMLA
jgi:PHD/YefM family antitoxin component YafN of YafNO toxin-antitoxin module